MIKSISPVFISQNLLPALTAKLDEEKCRNEIATASGTLQIISTIISLQFALTALRGYSIKAHTLNLLLHMESKFLHFSTFFYLEVKIFKIFYTIFSIYFDFLL